MARPIVNPITYGTLSGNVPMSDLDTSFNALFTTGFNDSSLGWVNYAADTGTANAYAVTLSVTPSSYTSGMCVAFTPQNTNTGTSTINVNALGTKAIVNRANIALQGGEIPVNKTVVAVYDGTSFRIVSYCALAIDFNNITGNKTVECAGYDSVGVFVSWNAATSTTVTLNHLGYGIPITVAFSNASGGGNTYSITATEPSGTAYVLQQASFPTSMSGASGQNLGTGGTLSASSIITFTGVSAGAPGDARLLMSP